MRDSAAVRLAAVVGIFISTAFAASLFWRPAGRAGAEANGSPPGAASAAASEPSVFRVPPTVFRVEALGRLSDRMTRASVVRVVDGDTIVVEPDRSAGLARVEKVRLIGVDTPETVDPRRPVQAFGKEASAYLKRRVEGREVGLAFESGLRDRYGRLLAYVFLPDGSCVNLDIVADGFGHAYVKYPFLLSEDFLAAERKARERGLGLWGGGR